MILTIKYTVNKEARTANSTYPKGGVFCSAGNFLINASSLPQINFSTKTPHLLIAPILYPLPLLSAKTTISN
jgi:hypothetical protein